MATITYQAVVGRGDYCFIVSNATDRSPTGPPRLPSWIIWGRGFIALLLYSFWSPFSFRLYHIIVVNNSTTAFLRLWSQAYVIIEEAQQNVSWPRGGSVINCLFALFSYYYLHWLTVCEVKLYYNVIYDINFCLGLSRQVRATHKQCILLLTVKVLLLVGVWTVTLLLFVRTRTTRHQISKVDEIGNDWQWDGLLWLLKILKSTVRLNSE